MENNRKVWLAWREYSCGMESYKDVIGVYDSEEKAEAAILAHKRKGHRGYYWSDDVAVQ